MAKANKKSEKKNGKAAPGENEGAIQWRNTLILSGIVLYTFVLYSGGIHSQFVTWDDPDYITQNLLIRDLSFHGIIKIFTTPVIGMYNPIPFLVYAIEYKFWGLTPEPYNFFSIVFHLLATIAIFKFIFRLSKRYEVAAIVALLFAIHPMHTSVVMWASEIKTSLSILFYFVALNAYLNYIDDKYKIKYLVYAAIAIILSALSKPGAVTFAPMLFLLDYYRGRKMDKRMFLEKIPFFVISLFFGILTLVTHSQEKDTIFEVTKSYSFINYLLVSNYAIVFYFQKLFFPVGLCLIYPYPENSAILPIEYYVAIPVIPLIIFMVYKSGKFRKELLFGILFFVIAISVLLRLVPSGFFGMANRYSYLSYIGLFFIIGQFVTYVIDDKFSYARKIKNYVLVLLCVFFIFCSYRSVVRMKVWQNSITLFDDVISKQPKLVMAYNHRAAAKSFTGDYQGAIADEDTALSIDSLSADAYSNRAVFKDIMKDYNGAIKDCDMAIKLNPGSKDAHMNLANVNFHRGHLQEALQEYNSTLQLDTAFGTAYFNRALVKASLLDTIGALKDWERANELGIEQSKQFILSYSKNAGSAPEAFRLK